MQANTTKVIRMLYSLFPCLYYKGVGQVVSSMLYYATELCLGHEPHEHAGVRCCDILFCTEGGLQ